MIKLKTMIGWNYKEAWNFFTQNAYQQYIPEAELYVKSLDVSPTLDLRNNPQAHSLIMNSINPRSFILIDGASANGKTTLAERIAKQTNGIIVDIDLLCKDWMEEQMQTVKTRVEMFELITNMDELTDQYLLDELENIIYKKSKLGRPVILVGMYLELIYRAIISRTLGKYFERVISLVCCEKSFRKVENFINERNKKFSSDLPFEKEKCLQQYRYAKQFIERANGFFLGVGMTSSFIVDSTVSNMFK